MCKSYQSRQLPSIHPQSQKHSLSGGNKAVMFSSELKRTYEIDNEIVHVSGIYKKIWYSKMDLELIECKNQNTILKIEQGYKVENKTETCRGLELLVNTVDSMERSQLINESRLAVLNEQNRQRQNGIQDMNAIASCYKESGSLESQYIASQQGIEDEKVVIEMNDKEERKKSLKGNSFHKKLRRTLSFRRRSTTVPEIPITA